MSYLKTVINNILGMGKGTSEKIKEETTKRTLESVRKSMTENHRGLKL